jgi:intein/homing endonuclease
MSKEDLFKLINDRLEGWELAELLEVDAEDICLAFEDQVLDKIESIKELLNIDTVDDGEEEETHNYDDFE